MASLWNTPAGSDDDFLAAVKKRRKASEGPRDQKAIDHYVTEEKQKQIDLDQTSTVTDILDFIDNINRPFYGVTSRVMQGIKDVKSLVTGEVTPQTKKARPLKEQLLDPETYIPLGVKGLTREERYNSRDIFRAIAPKTLDWIEKNTKFSKYGHDEGVVDTLKNPVTYMGPVGAVVKIMGALDADAASVPLFVADVALDPLTWIPFGLPMKAAKGAMQITGKGMVEAASKVLGEAKVAKYAGSASDLALKTITPLFNVRKVFTHYGGEEVGKMLDTFISAKEAAAPMAQRTARKLSVVGKRPVSAAGERLGFLNQTNMLTEKESVMLGEALYKANDEATIATKELRAKHMGISVDELAKVQKLDDILTEVNLTDSQIHKDFLMKKLNEEMLGARLEAANGPIKTAGKLDQYLIQNLNEDKGVRQFARKMAMTEKDATLGYVETEFRMHRDLYNEGLKSIQSKIGTIQTTLKSNLKVTGQLLRDDIADVGRSLKSVDQDLSQVVGGASEELLVGVKEKFGLLKDRVQSLNKYMIAETGGSTKPVLAFDAINSDMIKSAFRSTKDPAVRSELKRLMQIRGQKFKAPTGIQAGLGKAEQEIMSNPKVVEAFGRIEAHLPPSKAVETLAAVKGHILELESKISQAQVASVGEMGAQALNQVRGQLRQVSNELKKFRDIRGSELNKIKGSAQAAGEITGQLADQHKNDLRALLKQQTDLRQGFVKQVVRREMAYRKADRMVKAQTDKYYRAFKSLKNVSGDQKFLQEQAQVMAKIFKQSLDVLPESLKQPFIKIRGLLDDELWRASQGVDPLFQGGSPLYAPRVQKDKFIQQVTNDIYASGTSKGFLKHREFQTYPEFEEWVRSKGGEPQKDIVLALMSHMENFEMTLAKHNFKNALLQHFGAGTEKDLELPIQQSLKYLFAEGKSQSSNKFVQGIAKVGGSINRVMKFMLTVPNLAFQGRNILGFNLLAATTAGTREGFNLANNIDAMLVKMGDNRSIRVKGVEIPMSFIREQAEKSGYWGSSFQRSNLFNEGKITLQRYSRFNPLRWIGEGMKLSQNIEDWGRYTALIANIKSGKFVAKGGKIVDIDEALKAAKDAMFEYNLINSPADKALQAVMGFYVWPRRNVPAQFKAIFNDPKQYATMAKIVDRLSNREQLSDEETATLSNYERETLKIVGTSVKGVRTFTMLGFTPVESAYQTVNSLIHWDTGKMVSQIAPAASFLMDWAYGKDSFYGEDFGNYLGTGYAKLLPQRLTDALGLKRVIKDKMRGGEVVGKEEVLFGDPNTVFLIRRFPFGGRLINSLASLVESEEKGKAKAGAVVYTTGIREKELDLKQRQKQRRYKVQEALREEAKKGGASEFKQIYVPKGQVTDPRKLRKIEHKRFIEELRGAQ